MIVVEDPPVGAHRAVGLRVCVRDGDIALLHLDEPVLGSLAGHLEAERPRRPSEQRLVRPGAELGEESGDRVGHRRHRTRDARVRAGLSGLTS